MSSRSPSVSKDEGYVVAVYVEGVEIKVMGVFDNSEEGQAAAQELEDRLDSMEDSQPGTVNWIFTESMLPNVIVLPKMALA